MGRMRIILSWNERFSKERKALSAYDNPIIIWKIMKLNKY